MEATLRAGGYERGDVDIPANDWNSARDFASNSIEDPDWHVQPPRMAKVTTDIAQASRTAPGGMIQLDEDLIPVAAGDDGYDEDDNLVGYVDFVDDACTTGTFVVHSVIGDGT